MTPDERARYARHLSLPDIGEAGQAKLAAGRVLVVGAGGLGSPAALYLAAAGVGAIGLMDHDRVDLSNLQRQILHATADVGRLKVESGAATLNALNPHVRVTACPEAFTAAWAAANLAGWDVVIDATDRFASKFAIARGCAAAGRPSCHAGIAGHAGHALTVLPGRSACYGCVFGEAEHAVEPPPAGPFGFVPGVLGAIQAAETVKLLLGAGKGLSDRLLLFDAWTMELRTTPVQRRAGCAVCGALGK